LAMFLQVVFIAGTSSTERIDLICHYAKLGRLNFINILINLVNGKEDLSYGLPYAANGGHLEVVQRLLDAKADVNATTNGVFAQTALQAAAEGGHLEVVQRLLDAKADVNAVTNGVWAQTALQSATKGGHLEVVALLKSFGARK
jgi:ABC-type phosphate/phosphonate transport system substrate-binding protein